MRQKLAHIALVVRNYDEAIHYYTQVLGFQLIEDTRLSDTKRWVLVQPQGHPDGCCLLLAQAASEVQASRIGDQTGGRVFLFLHTDNFDRDYDRYQAAGVHFVRPKTAEPYGTVAVFSDLYGNLWDLIQPI